MGKRGPKPSGVTRKVLFLRLPAGYRDSVAVWFKLHKGWLEAKGYDLESLMKAAGEIEGPEVVKLRKENESLKARIRELEGF